MEAKKLNDSFYVADCNNRKVFHLNLPQVGEVKVDFFRFGDFSFHFGLHGAVSSSGYRSNFFHPDSLVDFESPEQVAEKLALELYQKEGKLYQSQLRIKILENSQLRLF